MADNYQRILVGLDGSTIAQQAFEEAVAVAKRNRAALFIASIVPDNEYASVAVGASMQMINAETAEAEKRVHEATRYAEEHGVTKVVPIVRVADPRRALAETLPVDYHIDLIMLGITGKGVIQRLLVGSVAQYVSRHATTNVMLVKQRTLQEPVATEEK